MEDAYGNPILHEVTGIIDSIFPLRSLKKITLNLDKEGLPKKLELSVLLPCNDLERGQEVTFYYFSKTRIVKNYKIY